MTLRILANENIPSEAVEALRRAGHDVAWIRLDAPGSTDERVLERAQAEGRILITFDKDFGELAFRRGTVALNGVILFRVEAKSSATAATLVVAALHSRSDWAGHFSVVEEGRVRMTALPSGKT